MVPERAAAMPNRPLFRIFMATLNPPPIPFEFKKEKCNNYVIGHGMYTSHLKIGPPHHHHCTHS